MGQRTLSRCAALTSGPSSTPSTSGAASAIERSASSAARAGGQGAAARAHLARARDEALEEARREALLQEQARGGAADLAVGPEAAEHDPLHHALQVEGRRAGVVEDERGRLAAQLERHLAHARRAGAHDAAAGGEGAGEAHLGDERVRRQRRAGHVAAAGQHVEHAARQAHLRARRQRRQLHRAQRRVLARLQHARAPRGQRRRHLHARATPPATGARARRVGRQPSPSPSPLSCRAAECERRTFQTAMRRG
eukprot:scaffold2262_cov312-Prasinococcus_capsulatus_cf.AAC.4